MRNGKKNRGCNIRTISLFFIFCSFGYSQSYPAWFLSPGRITTGEISAGYAITGYYQDSTLSLAFRNGCENMAKRKACSVSGGQGFWQTEAGMFWMGSDIKVHYDSSKVEFFLKNCEIKDSFSTHRLTVVFVCNKDFHLADSEKQLVNLSSIHEPNWMNKLPQGLKYYYAVGQAPNYYYESSSWIEAEESALINLAKQKCVKIEALEMKDARQGQSIIKEELSVSLNNVTVEQRWVDVEKNIFYVLVKMPKK